MGSHIDIPKAAPLMDAVCTPEGKKAIGSRARPPAVLKARGLKAPGGRVDMLHGGRDIHWDVNPYAFLADAIVIVHFCYVLFTVGGEIAIVLGGLFHWRWVRGMALRITHLAACVLVAVEAIAGKLCPLTTWEYDLRVMAGQRVQEQISFIARLVRSVIFYDFPAWVFLLMYMGFGALVIITFILIPPRRRPSR
jgi:hypothetical protein